VAYLSFLFFLFQTFKGGYPSAYQLLLKLVVDFLKRTTNLAHTGWLITN